MARLRDGIGGTLVLDAEGLVKLAKGDLRALARAKNAYAREARLVTAATTLTEVLRGGPRDAQLHHVLRRVGVIAVDAEQARAMRRTAGPHRPVRPPLRPRRTTRHRSDGPAPTSHPADKRHRRHDQAHARTKPPSQGTRGGGAHLRQRRRPGAPVTYECICIK